MSTAKIMADIRWAISLAVIDGDFSAAQKIKALYGYDFTTLEEACKAALEWSVPETVKRRAEEILKQEEANHERTNEMH